MWDTPSQESFQAINQMLYHSAQGFILLYDTDNGQSLRDIEQRWLPAVRRSCPSAKMLLLGNKIDLQPSVDLEVAMA
jgi:small GTP-binding protein